MEGTFKGEQDSYRVVEPVMMMMMMMMIMNRKLAYRPTQQQQQQQQQQIEQKRETENFRKKKLSQKYVTSLIFKNFWQERQIDTKMLRTATCTSGADNYRTFLQKQTRQYELQNK
jgi:hypothetical protein